MKAAEFELEFLSHVLACGREHGEDCDVFARDRQGRIVFQPGWWYSALTKAISQSHHKNVKAGEIVVDLVFTADTEIYDRPFGRHQEVRRHECIVPGSVVKFKAMIDDRVTETAIMDILEVMGRFVGISPYGHNLGAGRFNVHSLKLAKSEK